ncbi:MAG: RICIN domain-containing protein [Saprospiraceae bacterium]|nr:RICIN domain-containing protein [Saprospiraceae bacterium]
MKNQKLILSILLLGMFWKGYTQITPGTYTITTKLIDRRLDIKWADKNNGAGLHIWDPNGGEAQKFKVENSNEADYYYIKSEWGKCLTVNGSDPNILDMWDCVNGNNQKWKFINTRDDHHNIQSKLGTYIDVRYGKKDNGSEVGMSAYSNWEGNIAQRWKLNNFPFIQFELPPRFQTFIIPDSVLSFNYFDELINWLNANDFNNYTDNTKSLFISSCTLNDNNSFKYSGYSKEKSWRLGGNSNTIFKDIYIQNFRKQQISQAGLGVAGEINSFSILKENNNTWVKLNNDKKVRIKLYKNMNKICFVFKDESGFYHIGLIEKKIYNTNR